MWPVSRRWRYAGVAAVLVAVAVAIPVARSAGATAAGNLGRARTEAARLLTLLHVPPGAVELTSEPRVLRAPSFEQATPNLVDAHHWWSLHGEATSVLAYVTARLPRGAQQFVSGSGGFAPVYRMKAFLLAPLAGVLSERVLAVSVAQVSPSTTVVRTDGEAVWVVPRPASEQLPARIDEIDITSRSFTTQAQIVSLKVTNGAQIGQIVKSVNAMAIAQPGVINCPLLDGPTVTLVFRTAGGRQVARASGMDSDGTSGACNALDLRLGGRSEPPLVGDLFDRMQRLLGGRFERSGQASGGLGGTPVMAPPRPADRVRTLDALRGDGIGGLRFGASPTAVRTAMDSLLGQQGGAYRPGGSCGLDHWIKWADQWTPSGEPALTVYFRRSAFAGYQVGDAVGPSVLRPQHAGWSLATTRGLRVGGSLIRGRWLYGHRFTLSFAQGGSWELRTDAGRFVGYAWGTPPPSHADVSWQSYVATIDAGDVGCAAVTP
jgi:hypothetical protein